jgi:NADH dehydrogenase/NADH:ubiquinone oxidoreductase subunit G
MSESSHLMIYVNERPIQVQNGLTILQAARLHQIEIPTLCDYPGLPPSGSCRMCIVEILGRQNTPTACTTPVEDGMVIYTHSPKVLALRRALLQMLLAEHPSGCLYCPEQHHCQECMITLRKSAMTTGCGSCPKDEQCELQSLAESLGINQPNYPIRYRMLPVHKHDPFFDRDDNLCILCGRCVRICEDQHFTGTLTFVQRGAHAVVGTAFNRTHQDSSCTFCGSCVEVCPTGALSEKTRKWSGVPESTIATTCPFCSIGCQINLLVKNSHVIGSLPNRQAGSNVLCVKGRFAITELVNHPDRMVHPQKFTHGFHQGINWEEAVEIAAEKLTACATERFEMRISASSTNEDIFVAKQFAREVMRSSNIFTSGTVNVGQGMQKLLSVSRPLDTLHTATVILTLGLMDPYALPVVEAGLLCAKSHGAKWIHVGAGNNPWTVHSDIHLYSTAGQEVDALQRLLQLSGKEAVDHSDDPAESKVADLLLHSKNTVILIGPDALAHSNNPALVEAVDQFVQKFGAQIIVLADQVNLVGALQLGLKGVDPKSVRQDKDVLFLIGEMMPENLPDHLFVIYQNLHSPKDPTDVDLLLPAAAFTEDRGTFIDNAGRVKILNPAVPPPGEALPSWMILSRIAQKMGVSGFDYMSVEDIWSAAQKDYPGFPEIFSITEPNGVEPRASGVPVHPETGTPMYMGSLMEQWVEGLRSLYPVDEIGEQP